MSDEQLGRDERIDALEETVRRLSADVLKLQSATQAAAPALVPLPLRKLEAAARPEPPTDRPTDLPTDRPTDRPADPARPRSPMPPRATTSRGVVSGGVEQAIGRYGTLVVATLAILLGLGAFMQWAIARGLLGPEMRVALGAVAAVVLAALGVWLRKRGNRAFGNAVFAIALAVVHLVAWGAGPGLGLVPAKLALAVAAAASAALAALALREGEQTLFVLGLGGALIAPFVTSTGSGETLELLAFGTVVLSAAIFALRDASWRVALRLLAPFALGYMAAAAAFRQVADGIGSAYWPTAFAVVLAIVALTVGARSVRRDLVKSMLVLVGVGLLLASGLRHELPWTGIAYAMLGTLTVHALRRRTRASGDRGPDTWIEVVGLPLMFMFLAIGIDDVWKEREGGLIAAAWAVFTIPFLLLDPPTQRSRHATVMLVAAIAMASSAFHLEPLRIVVSFATIGALGVYLIQRLPGKALFLPIGLALGFGTLRAFILVSERTPWVYTPFVNQTAVAAAMVVLAWLFFSFTVAKALEAVESIDAADTNRKSWEPESTATMLAMIGPIMVFLWIRGELAYAVSRDIATFSLITYYALAGVGTILVGRKREIDGLRQTGLALTLFAAGKAFVAANALQSIGLRVGSYLIVGVFVLGVGYLYRAAPTDEPNTE